MAFIEPMHRNKPIITYLLLFVRKVKVDPSVQLEHIKGLERMAAKYPVQCVGLRPKCSPSPKATE